MSTRIMKVFILVSLLVAGISAVPLQNVKARFDNYKVYRFVPNTEGEVKTLTNLEETFPGINYWQRPGKIGHAVDVMIPPHLEADIVSGIQSTTMQVEAWIQNVQKLIDEEEAASILGRAKAPAPMIGWEAYYDYDEIVEFLIEQNRLHPQETSVVTYALLIAKTLISGKSFEGRDLYLITISSGGSKPIIFLDANIHASEWITNAVATYIINDLLNGEANGVRRLLDTFDFHIAPVLNPDGYQFSRDSNRMWMKTRSTYGGDLCFGADPNRNFGFHWNTGGSSNLCSSNAFMGVSAFSEPETKNISDYINTIQNRTVAYLSLHSYSQLILIPYGTRVNNSPRIPDHDNHMRIGNLVAQAIARRYNTRFEIGNFFEMIFVSSGGSADWVKGVHNTTISLSFELRDTGNYGFLLPPDQIIPSSLEFIDGLLVLGDNLKAQLKL